MGGSVGSNLSGGAGGGDSFVATGVIGTPTVGSNSPTGFNGNGQVRIQAISGVAIPEPASTPLLGMAIAGIGLAIWSRRRQSAAIRP